jgi:large subunit ribosomal protein L23
MAVEIGFELRGHEVLRRPLITEKTMHLSERHNTFVFLVDTAATKQTVKKAVEEHWSVRVVSVRIQNRVGKTRRFKAMIGETSPAKRALVTLHEDDRIALF